ncbi:MAG: site-2 protease family protein, partial [Thermoplasmata archaeon]|nr:site-2 protease family protein [Thermoplasmata archaeon]
GMFQWASYADVPADETFSVDTLAMGIVVFAFPLLAILGVHELGHYFMARRRKVAASLPFFIPSIPPLGTFGAFISLRDPIPNRKSLLEIGIAGPLAGLAVALPIAFLGIMLTNMGARPVPEDIGSGGIMLISFPYIYTLIEQIYPIQGDFLMHPTAFAAWVGFLVTALNLLPAGQLDGGHIARALLGRNAKYASWATIAALIVLSFWYFAWLIFAVLILFIGAKHPPPLNDITKLDRKRMVLGAFAFVILVVSMVPVPMSIMESDWSFEVTTMDDTNMTAVAGETVVFSMLVENTGNTQNTLLIEQATVPEGWTVDFGFHEEPVTGFEEPMMFVLNVSASEVLDVRIRLAPNTTDGNWSVSVLLYPDGYSDDSTYEKRVDYLFEVISPTLDYSTSDDIVIAAGDEMLVYIDLVQYSLPSIPVTIQEYDNEPVIGIALYEVDPAHSNATEVLNLTLEEGVVTTFSALIFVSGYSLPGEITVMLSVTYADTTILTIELDLTVV